jgi:hypothetical protein
MNMADLAHGFIRGLISFAAISMLIASCLMYSGCTETPAEEELAMAEFNSILGVEKVSALDTLIQIFQQHIYTEFPQHKTLEAQTEAYLKRLSHDLEKQKNITPLASEVSARAVRTLEHSGLRQELVLCNSETYQPNPVVKSLFDQLEQSISDSIEHSGVLDMITLEEEIELDTLNSAFIDSAFTPIPVRYYPIHYGVFKYALVKAFWNDPVCHGYLEALVLAGDLSPSLLIGGLLESSKTFSLSHPVWQRIIAAEIFLWHIDWGSYCQERFPASSPTSSNHRIN